MGFELLPPLPTSAFTGAAAFDPGAYADQMQQQRVQAGQAQLAQIQADQDKLKQQQAAQASAAAVHAVLTNPNPQTYAAALALNPTLRESLQEGHKALQEDQQRQALENFAAVHGNLNLANDNTQPADARAAALTRAKGLLQQRIDADRAAGIDTSAEEAALASMDEPGGATAAQGIIGTYLTANAPTGYDKLTSQENTARVTANTERHDRATEQQAADQLAFEKGKPIVVGDGSVLVDPNNPGGAPAAAVTPAAPVPPVDDKTLAQIRANPQAFFSQATGVPVNITSGARSAEHNAAVGGSKTSEHLTNSAWDMTPPPGTTNAQLIAQLRASNLPYDQIIDEGDHVHVGFGPKNRGQVLQQVAGGHYVNIGAPTQTASAAPAPAGGRVLFDNRHPEQPGHASTAAELAAAGLPPGTAAWTGKDGKPVPYPAEFQQNVAGGAVDPKLAGLAGPALLKALPAGQAAQVQALAEGRLQFPSGMALSKPYWQQMLGLVGQYDPSFDQANPRSRASTRVDFTSGKSAQNITALNTVIGHLDDLDHAIDGLHNVGGAAGPAINSAINWTLGGAKANPEIAKFETAKTAVANELTRVFRGTGGAEADIQAWQKQLDAAGSPEALRSVVHAMASLINSRLEALGEQYSQGMGVSQDPIRLLTPDKQAAFDRMRNGLAPGQVASAGAPKRYRYDASGNLISQ